MVDWEGRTLLESSFDIFGVCSTIGGDEQYAFGSAWLRFIAKIRPLEIAILFFFQFWIYGADLINGQVQQRW